MDEFNQALYFSLCRGRVIVIANEVVVLIVSLNRHFVYLGLALMFSFLFVVKE